MTCEMCDTDMEFKKRYFYGKKNSNVHYRCPKCPTTCVVHIRLGEKYRELWRYKNVEWERSYIE